MESSGVGQHENHDDGNTTLLTAMDLPVEDAGVHHIGQCRLITAQHLDCGLIWADYSSYPSNAVLAHSKRARKRNKKKPETIVLESEESTGLVLQLQQLGLPPAFGTSKGEAYDEEEDSCVPANDPADDQQHQFAEDEDVHHHDDSADDQLQYTGAHLPAVQTQESACEWQQAYDDAYGCFYYYRERTQETQWEQPSDGFLPAPAEWLAYAQQQQQQQQQQASTIQAEARLLDDPPLQSDIMTGWYSATPEVLAAHHAAKCRCSVIVDAFAGVGGNAIQFALTCDRVIAVELSAQRLELAKHNAEVYGVAHKIDFICGDFLQVAATLQADMVFLSPPWGGPAYSKSGLFDVSQEIGSLHQNLRQLLHTASLALKDPDSRRIACFLPRNTDLNSLGVYMPNEQHCLVERNILNSHLKAVTVYYGSLADI
ncbi:hypothetical protein WJX79_010788 [Trebouxia sp. C0005]